MQSKCEQLKYELDTNPDPEIAKAYNTKMLELKQSIEEANEFVSQVSKYGKALEPYADMLTNAVEAASGFYTKAKGINRQAKNATK